MNPSNTPQEVIQDVTPVSNPEITLPANTTLQPEVLYHDEKPNGSNSHNTSQNKKTISGLSFWLRFIAVIGYISGGFTTLFGLPTSIIGVGIPILAMGIFQLLISRKLWLASNNITALDTNSDDYSFRINTFKALDDLKFVYKWQGILAIAAVLILPIIFSLALFSALINTPNQIFNQTTCNFTRQQDRLEFCNTNNSKNPNNNSKQESSAPRIKIDFPDNQNQ